MSYNTFKNHCIKALSTQKNQFESIYAKETYIRKLFVKVFKLNTYQYRLTH
jgi:hypothetical protein